MKLSIKNNKQELVKKVLILLLSFVVLFALATLPNFAHKSSTTADAADSPSLPSATKNGMTLQVLGAEAGDCNNLIIRPVDDVVPGVEIHEELGEVLVANYYLTTKKGETYLPDYYNVSFAVGAEMAKKVAGRDARIYILHHDGEFEVRNLKFNDSGIVSFTLHKLSILSVVTSFNDVGDDTGKNVSSVSPKTGFTFDLVFNQ